MTKKLFISQLEKKYKVCYIHNPKHFFLNTVWIENLPDGRKVLKAHPRPHNKQFHVLAILKPRVSNRAKVFVERNTVPLSKPFNGIFVDK